MNIDIILTAVIAATPATIAALAALVQSVRTHQIVNSRMTEMLELNRQQATDSATLAEKRAEHVRKGEAAVTSAIAAELKGEGNGPQ